jgi:hypothetical protein
MHKLKLAIFLPIIQFAIAVILLKQAGRPDFYVPTSKLICWGLNAPALLFRGQALWGPISVLVPGSIRGVDAGDLFFLLGVIVVWYLVGRALDRKRNLENECGPIRPMAVVAHCFLLVVGGLLLYVGAALLGDVNYRGRPERGILTLLWAVSLLFFSGRALMRSARRRVAKS